MTKSLRSRLDPMVGRLQLFTAQQHFNHGYESALLLLQTSVPSAYVELRPGLCQLFIILIYYTLTFFFLERQTHRDSKSPSTGSGFRKPTGVKPGLWNTLQIFLSCGWKDTSNLSQNCPHPGSTVAGIWS